MASQQQVKQYLAYWLQLGKKVVVDNGAATMRAHQVIKGDRYSDEFEEIWQRIISNGAKDCYLQGTQETIAELLTPAWEMNTCCRCSLPVPVHSIGMPSDACPCNDLPSWPNTELPKPRPPINSQEQLREIHARLLEQKLTPPPA